MAFTVHGIDEELDLKLNERAQREHISKNHLVKNLLARAMGLSSGNGNDDDYREFLGKWTDEDLREFELRQIENNQVNPVDWK
jgi:hypothetical protein